MEAGRPHGIRPIAPCEARRIEAGIFNYGSDMTIADTPFHVMGLERLVEPQDADYIGKAALEEIRRKGVDRKLVGIEVAGDALPFELSRKCDALSGGRAGRDRHRPHLVAAAREEHRLRLGADRARRTRQRARDRRARRRHLAGARPRRSRSSTRRRTFPRAEPPAPSRHQEIVRDRPVAAHARRDRRRPQALPGRLAAARPRPTTTRRSTTFERDGWFRRDWVRRRARGGRRRASGTYFLATVDDEPLIVVRGRDDVLRAFYNVCRHRGTAVVEEPCGKAVRFQCPYHAWIYDLDGRLVRAKHTDDLDDFSFDAFGLAPVRLGDLAGLRVRQPRPRRRRRSRPGSATSCRTSGGSTSAALRVAPREIVYEVDANWKFIAENYSECYHCPGIHPQLNKLTPYDLGGDFEPDGPWQGGWMELVDDAETMALDGGHRARPAGDGRDHRRSTSGGSTTTSCGRRRSSRSTRTTCSSTGSSPPGPDHTRIVCQWLFEPDTIAAPGFDPSDAVGFWDLTNRQDWHVCELQQRGTPVAQLGRRAATRTRSRASTPST